MQKRSICQDMRLSPEIKEAIVKQLLLGETYRAISPPPSQSYREGVSEYLSVIGLKAHPKKMTAGSVASAIIEWKAEKVKKTIPEAISINAKNSEITLDKKASNLLRKSLYENTEKLAKSGFTPDQIEHLNNGLIVALFQASPQKRMGKKEYNIAKKTIFRRLVHLTIDSNPQGANVFTASRPIGQTVINKKPFEPGKEYLFKFQLDGYLDAQHTFYISPYPNEQKFIEILKLKK